MLDRATPLHVQGRIADRQAEARARRLAAEASAGQERTFWLTDGLRAVAASRRAIVARVSHVQVRPGSALAPSRDQA